MIRALKTLLLDSISWGLVFLLAVTVVAGVSTLFNRYEKYDTYRYRLYAMQQDIKVLQKELAKKREWLKRLDSDSMAWEEVARQKMNFLRPDEVLVLFTPSRQKK